jgi:hypothetical protein
MVSVDYDDGTGYCTCPADDYCRCGTIVNTSIKYIRPYEAQYMVNTFVKGDDLEQLLAFMFFRHCLESDDFDVTVCGGDYGEEIDDVRLTDSGYEKIARFNSYVEAENTQTLLVMVLAGHYGYVLPEILKYEKWELISVPTSKIMASKAGMAQVKSVGYDYWDDRQYPSFYPGCLVVPCCDDKLRIIDGFHRWTHFNSKKKRRKVKVLAPIVDKNND